MIYTASIFLGGLGKFEHRVAFSSSNFKGKWVPMDHSKSKKHEGVALYLVKAATFRTFTHNSSSCFLIHLWQSACDRDLIHPAISFHQ